MSQIKFNIVDSDPTLGVTFGKKIKFKMTGLSVGEDGYPLHMTGVISYHESNDSDVVPPNNILSTRQALSPVEIRIEVVGKIIDSTTLQYLPSLTDGNGDPIANAVLLSSYLETKVINQYPGVSGTDQAWKFYEGVAKHIIDVLQANDELPE